jgi:hypothetical protein
MSEPRNVTLQIGRGGGLSLRVNDSYYPGLLMGYAA